MTHRDTHVEQFRDLTWFNKLLNQGFEHVAHVRGYDVVWRNRNTGATAVWLMDSSGMGEGATFPGGAELDWELRP